MCKNQHYSHIRIYTDNTTSCTYINNYGGKTADLDKLARDIWMWCLEHNVYLIAAHIPGTSNSEADKMSRSFNKDLEWALVPQVFQKILDHFPDLSIDLFASRLNHKLAKYVLFQPEPSAFAVKAFSIEWTGALYYIFSPFSLISKVLQKLEEDKTGSHDCTTVDNTGVVGSIDKINQRSVFFAASSTNNIAVATEARMGISLKENAPGSFQTIRTALSRKGVPSEAADIMESWKKSKEQYNVYIKKWISFCGTHIDPIQPTVNNILAFFVSLFRKGVKYSVFQTARTAINNFTSICSGTDFSTHPLIKRFMTGVFAKRPSLPKYTSIWDVNIVLSYIYRMENTTLFQLSCKLCMLFLLLTAQRCQTLHMIQT